MRMTSESQAEQELEFARKAAEHFAMNPQCLSFSDRGLEPGALVALRWGLMDRSVAVLRISDDEPVLFSDMIRPPEPGPDAAHQVSPNNGDWRTLYEHNTTPREQSP